MQVPSTGHNRTSQPFDNCHDGYRCIVALLAAGQAPTDHVHLHVLLTYEQTGALALAADGVLLALLAAYLVGTHRLRRRGHRWSWQRTAWFGAGLAVVWAAVGSGLAAYDDVNLPMHVLQHMLLMALAPPLLIAGRPVTLAIQVVPRRPQRALVRVVNGRVVRVLTGPLAWLCSPAVMAAFFLTPAYAMSERHPLVHDAWHGLFLLAGYLSWSAILGPDGARGARHPGRRIVTVLASMPLDAAVGAALLFWPRSIGPGATLASTHEAGQLLWMLSMLDCGYALAVVLRQWIAADERRVRRLDAQLDALEAAVTSGGARQP